MANNVIRLVPPQKAVKKEAPESKRKVKLLALLWKAILENVGEGLLFSGWINVFLGLIYVLIFLCARESPFNSELPYVVLGFLWGFFSVTLNYDLRKK